MKEFEGKVALVTGGTSGIGQATALAFAKEGAKVVIAARSVNRGEEVLKLIAEANGEAILVQCDVSNSADVQSLIQKIVQKYGKLDYACNNAGIDDNFKFPTTSYPEEMWDEIISINLTGNFLSMKYEIQEMLKLGGGAIVNMSSAGGIVAIPNAAGYVASKAGQIGLTKTAALEYGHQGIRVNAVCPGPILTPMVMRQGPESLEQIVATVPLKRIGKVEEVAGAVLWLCSDAASFVNGHAMVVDGGYTAH
jgi:NAD(P)-dependent dehydrogenase (short-subunit alcohol dehydrogenase family)